MSLDRARSGPRPRRSWAQRCVSPQGLVAGFGFAAAESCVEALAAGAALDRVRIDDGETAAHERVDEVDMCSVEVLQREGIDHDLDAALLHDLVVLGCLRFQGHAVRAT